MVFLIISSKGAETQRKEYIGVMGNNQKDDFLNFWFLTCSIDFQIPINLCASAPPWETFGTLLSSVCEEIRDGVSARSGGIESTEELALNVFSQATAFATALDHFVGNLFGGSGYQIVRFQPQILQEAVQGLFAEIAF